MMQLLMGKKDRSISNIDTREDVISYAVDAIRKIKGGS
jgi:hypothetical protein